jgi:hypothetical protein
MPPWYLPGTNGRRLHFREGTAPRPGKQSLGINAGQVYDETRMEISSMRLTMRIVSRGAKPDKISFGGFRRRASCRASADDFRRPLWHNEAVVLLAKELA